MGRCPRITISISRALALPGDPGSAQDAQRCRRAVAAGRHAAENALQPTQAEREQLLGWITAALDAEAAVRAGDPGR